MASVKLPQPVSLEQMRTVDANRYFRHMMWLSVVSCLLILLSASYGIYELHSRQVMQSAEQVSVNLAHALIAQERTLFTAASVNGGDCLSLIDTDRLQLNRRLHIFFEPFDVYKIKIYDCEHEIVHSTDLALIGKIDRDNHLLQQAFQGKIATKLVRKEEVVDLREEQRFDVDVVETYVPIRLDGDQVVGVIEVYADVSRFRYAGYVSTMRAVVMIAVIVVVIFFVAWLISRQIAADLRRAQDQLHVLATTDPLTGAANRGEILHRARDEAARLRRTRIGQKTGLSLLMVDLDHFKKVNDHYGHLAGDHVLRSVSECFAEQLRPYDMVGRYGGEEFLLLLPDTGFDAATAIAERIREQIAERVFHENVNDIRLTVSIGVASVRRSEDDYAPALKRADDALYLAKNGGRNRVCSLPDEGKG